MKFLFFLFYITIIGNTITAQNSSVEIKGDFADLAKLGRMQGGESLPSYSSNNVTGTRYLFEKWMEGSVTTVGNETIASKYEFMFDKQNNDLYIRQKDSATILLADKHMIKNFSLQDNQLFIQGAQIEGSDKDLFYAKLAGQNDKYSLYKSIKTKFIKANRQDAERIKMGNFDDEYKDEIAYFISFSNQGLKKIKLSENSIVKAFSGDQKKIQQYFDNHSSDEVNEKLVEQLVEDLNK